MANEQNKDTKDTSFDVNNQSTDFSNTTSDTSNSATTDFGNGEFGNAGTTNPDFSASNTPSTDISSTNTSSMPSSTGSTSDKSDSMGLSVESAKETAKGLYDQAKSTAGQAFGAATKRATEVLDEQKGTVTERNSRWRFDDGCRQH
jgi:hypothetical protein